MAKVAEYFDLVSVAYLVQHLYVSDRLHNMFFVEQFSNLPKMKLFFDFLNYTRNQINILT